MKATDSKVSANGKKLDVINYVGLVFIILLCLKLSLIYYNTTLKKKETDFSVSFRLESKLTPSQGCDGRE